MGGVGSILLTCVYMFFMWKTSLITPISAQAIFVANNGTAEKGQDVQLICDLGLTSGTWSSLVRVCKSNTTNFKQAHRDVTVCSDNTCLKYHPRCESATNGYNIFVNVSKLNRSEDEMFWTCVNSDTTVQMFLTVYTTPTALLLRSSFENSHSLSEGSLALTCETDSCVYKDPVFHWYLIYENGTRKRFDQGDKISWNSDILCDDSEIIYYNKLSIQENTTFSGNMDITVRFACTISFPTLKDELVSPPSGNVTFALQIETVELIDGDQATIDNSTVIVKEKEHYSVSCKPGPSRPQPIFLLYIGLHIIQESKNGTFTFTPDRQQHEDKIYCKAYNLQGIDKSIVSNKPTLFVNIPVSQVILRDENDNIENCSLITVSEGTFKTLTCTSNESRPTPNIVWYIGKNMRQNHTSNNFTFIPDMEDHNKSVYCIAYNLHRHEPVNSSKPILRVIGRPLLPMTFLFTGLHGRNATFYWVAGYDGGYSQVFVLQYRKLSETSWTNQTQNHQGKTSETELPCNAYTTQINNLAPGVYSARLIGRNLRGESSPREIMGSTFEIVHPVSEIESEHSQSSTPVVITSSIMGCLVLVLAGIIVYLLILLKRSQQPKSNATTEIKLDTITPISATESSSTVYDELTAQGQVTGQTYEVLERSDTRLYVNTTISEG